MAEEHFRIKRRKLLKKIENLNHKIKIKRAEEGHENKETHGRQRCGHNHSKTIGIIK